MQPRSVVLSIVACVVLSVALLVIPGDEHFRAEPGQPPFVISEGLFDNPNEARKWIRTHGGEAFHGHAQLFYGHHRFDGSFIVLPGIRWTDDDLRVIHDLPDVESLCVLNGPYSDSALRHLVGTQITSLDLSVHDPVLCNKGCGSGGCRCRAKAPPLGPGFSARALGYIARIHTIESLDLSGLPIDDEDLRVLRSMPKLEEVYVHDTNVRGPGRRSLPGAQVIGLNHGLRR